MKLHLMINGVPCDMDVVGGPPDCRFQVGDEPLRQAQVETPEAGVYSVLMDGRSYDAYLEESGRFLVVTIDGYRFEVEVRDPRGWSREDSLPGAGAVQVVAAPMPGKVVRVLVSLGDTVEPGQGLVVVEAMKMQNEMKAARAGRIATLPAREGATVTAGQVLATIE